MLFKGNSSKLELLIEKIQSNKENTTHDLREALGSEPGSTSSWRSDSSSSSTIEEVPAEGPSNAVAATKAAVPAGRASSASSSCSSSASSQPPDGELGFTLGVTEATPYPCQFCAKAFPRLSYLKKHEQSHAEHMPFRCEFCSRLFKHKRSRDRHVKLHTGDRKYRCTQCEAAFSRSDHLKIHMKTHDTQKPFQCSACNRGYNTAAALTSHSQTHKRPPSLPATLPPRNSPRYSPPSSLPPRRVTPAPSPAAPAFPRNLTPTTPHPHDLLRAAHPAAAAAAAVLFNRELQQVLAHEASSPPGSARSALNAAAMAAAALAHSAGLQFPTHTLACIYCTKDGFTSMEQLQLHVQAMHGSILNGEREYQPPSPSRHLSSARQPPVSPSQPYTCDFCTMKFDHLQGLHKHSMAVHAMSPATQFGATAEVAEQLKPTDLSTNGKSNGKSPGRRTNDTMSQNMLLCNQCNAPCPDFESFRTHLRTHLDAELGKAGSPPKPPPPRSNNNVVHHFQCPECPEAFSNENQLEVHCLGHFLATSTEFSCQSCLKSFSRPDELQKHLMDSHSHQLFRCALCREIFDSRVAAQVHFAVKHSTESRVLRCVACGESSAKFRSEIEFSLHVKIHHLSLLEKQASVAPLRCPYCNEFFKSEGELQYHVSNFHQKLYRCKLCDDAFQVEFLLEKHMELKHKEEKKSNSSPHKQQKSPTAVVSLVCAYCNESCKSRADLEAHMKTHHQTGGTRAPNGTANGGVALGRHKCNICDMVCVTPALLAEHKLATHCKVLHGDTCSVCKASLNGEEHFLSHMQKHCPGNGSAEIGLPTACIICRQTVTSEHEVQLHAKFHLQQKVFRSPDAKEQSVQAHDLVCKECSSRFESVSELEIHYSKYHLRKNNFECISCQLSFSTEGEVRAHVETAHAPDSGQRCRLCQESFDTPLRLQVHLIEHTFVGCPTFACYLCGAVFTAATGLQRHMNSHGASSKPYDCTKCHLRFFFRAELENHAFVHAGEDHILSCEPKKMQLVKEEEREEETPRRCCSEGDEQNEALSLALRKRKGEINGNEISSIVDPSATELELKKLKLETPEEQQAMS